jgi:hypothetical protein
LSEQGLAGLPDGQDCLGYKCFGYGINIAVYLEKKHIDEKILILKIPKS